MIALYFIALIAAACVITLLTIAILAFLGFTCYAALKPKIQPIIQRYLDWYERRTS